MGGSLFSALLNPGGPVSVGASGAIMGLLGASLVLSFHAAAEGRCGRLRLLALRLLIPALPPAPTSTRPRPTSRPPPPQAPTARAPMSPVALARVAAEEALRTGLAQTDVLDHDMAPQTRDALAATLAGLLADEGRLDEARTLAAPVCAEGSLRMRAVRAKLAQAKLCG